MLIVMPWRETGCPWRRRARNLAVGYWCQLGRVVEADSATDLFSRSAALNAAVRSVDSGEVIVAVDADLVVPHAQVHAAVALAEAEPGMVVPFDEGRYLGPHATERVLEGGSPWLAEPRWRFRPSASTPLVGGANVLSRETFEKVGGWPEEFVGWGCQDLAFAHLCDRVAPNRRVPGPMVHLHHPKTGDYVAAETKAANAERLRLLKEAT